jgi:acyl-coenzyme A thioesterase PaaI-like protein
MRYSPRQLKRIINIYPPYLGAGIKVDHISDDWKELRVSMALRWFNRNVVGTHFGGSLYALIDPHVMLLLMQLLGKEYIVWDKAASIKFIKASKKDVSAVIRISDEIIEEIKQKTENGQKYLPTFSIEIRDEYNELIATAEKVIYVKKKDLPD